MTEKENQLTGRRPRYILSHPAICFPEINPLGFLLISKYCDPVQGNDTKIVLHPCCPFSGLHHVITLVSAGIIL